MRHHQWLSLSNKTCYTVECVESVPEADSERVFKKLARKHDIVLSTSFGFMEPMYGAAEKNKKTFFLHAIKDVSNDKNLDNYVCHSFQARYLTYHCQV